MSARSGRTRCCEAIGSTPCGKRTDQRTTIEEFKVISVGEDIAAQIAAANNFIDQGFDAIIVNANNSSAFGGVVRKANDAGVVLLSFDNVIDDPNNIQINVDQVGLRHAIDLQARIKRDHEGYREAAHPAPATRPACRRRRRL